MSFISDYIPKSLEFEIRGKKESAHVKPSDIAKNKIRELFAENYYRKINGLYDVLVDFGARFSEGKAKKGLFIKGFSGVGKSFGVSVLARYFGWPVFSVKDHVEVAFMAEDGSFRKMVESENYFGKAMPVVFDDLGTETYPLNRYGTQYNLMADVLDSRYITFCHTGAPTIVTTNLSDEDLNRYGVRINSRFSEMFEFVNVTSKIDMRKAE